MSDIPHQFSARVQRWLYRDQCGWLSRTLSRAVAVNAGLRADHISTKRPEIPTIVIGGLTVGGAGKTPIAAFLAQEIARTRSVALVCRGWRGRESGARPILDVDPLRDGDEVAMLRSHLDSDIALWASRDLERGRILASQTAEVAIIDDGFQTMGLARSHNVVVVDATAPRRVMPAGPLREPLSALERADLIWIHKVDEPDAMPLPTMSERVVRSRYRPRAVRLPDGSRQPPEWLAGRQVAAVCGIGRPESFLHQLTALDADVIDGIVCGDHSSAPVRELDRLSRAGLLVTTEKDAVRWPGASQPAVLEVDIEILEGRDHLMACLTDWVTP